MNTTQLTNLNFHKDLHEKTLTAAAREKAASFALLECLHEVDQHRSYNVLGYSRLFHYVVKALGYSESQAAERIRQKV